MVKVNERKRELFWRHVNKNGPVPVHRPELGGCWVWTGGRLGKGYGSFRDADQKTVGAHCFSWAMTNGAVPNGMHVLHKCDRRECVRPSHLFTGTNEQNVADMVHKRRHAFGDKHMARSRPETLARGDGHWSRRHPEKRPKGEGHGGAKLTTADVIALRRRYAAGGISQAQLGAMFGVAQTVISAIVRRKNWRHVS